MDYNIYQDIIIVLADLFILFAVLTVKKEYRAPALGFLVWWCTWFTLAATGVTGLYEFSSKTLLVVYTMIASVLIGMIVASRMSKLSVSITRKEEESFDWIAIRCVYILGGMTLLWNLVLLPRALPLISIYGSSYRSAVFSHESISVFGSAWLAKIYSLTATPVAYFIGFLAIAIALRKRVSSPLVFSFIVLASSDLVRLGRAGTYALVLISTYMLLVLKLQGDGRGRWVSRRFSKLLFGVQIAVGIYLLGTISVMRDESSFGDRIQSTLISVVNYHTLGFGLLNNQLRSDESEGMQTLGYGRLTFGGVEQIFSLALRRINPNHEGYVTTLDDNWRQEPVVLGALANGTPIVGNAFYTTVFTLYHDGRLPFTIVMGFLYGFIYMRSAQRSLTYHSIYNISIFITLSYCGLFAIFLSPPEGTIFWEVLILIAILKFLSQQLETRQNLVSTKNRVKRDNVKWA